MGSVILCPVLELLDASRCNEARTSREVAMSKYLDDRFPNMGDDRMSLRGMSPHDSPTRAITREGKGAYHIRDRHPWDGDYTPTWPLDAEKSSLSSVASPRSRHSNVDHPLAANEQAAGRRGALRQWLSRRAVNRKTTVPGVPARLVILSAHVIPTCPRHQPPHAPPLPLFHLSPP